MRNWFKWFERKHDDDDKPNWFKLFEKMYEEDRNANFSKLEKIEMDLKQKYEEDRNANFSKLEKIETDLKQTKKATRRRETRDLARELGLSGSNQRSHADSRVPSGSGLVEAEFIRPWRYDR